MAAGQASAQVVLGAGLVQALVASVPTAVAQVAGLDRVQGPVADGQRAAQAAGQLVDRAVEAILADQVEDFQAAPEDRALDPVEWA